MGDDKSDDSDEMIEIAGKTIDIFAVTNILTLLLPPTPLPEGLEEAGTECYIQFYYEDYDEDLSTEFDDQLITITETFDKDPEVAAKKLKLILKNEELKELKALTMDDQDSGSESVDQNCMY